MQANMTNPYSEAKDWNQFAPTTLKQILIRPPMCWAQTAAQEPHAADREMICSTTMSSAASTF
jgi:pyruvate carboxylase